MAKIPEHAKQAAKQADLLALAERYTRLKKNAHHDWAGACPKCGGTDRFHVFQSNGEWRWRCYRCHEKPADAIDFVRWLQPNLSFADAVSRLATLPPAWPPAWPPARPAVQRQPAHKQAIGWRERVERMVAEAQSRLWQPEGESARAYLESRRLNPPAWLAYGLGVRLDVAVPGSDGKKRAPALVLPWRSGGKLIGVRYRFLEPQDGIKITAESGSRFAGRLFGGQVLPRVAERLRTLIVVEGEINCISIWQCSTAALDVLSLGSESAKLSPAAATAIGQYGRVLVWADREEVARALAAVLPNTHPIRSPGGKDANDLLREGLLGGFLAMVRADAARSMGELEALLWELWDTAHSPRGLDTGSAQVCRWLAANLGKRIELIEAEPDRWHTAERLQAAAPADDSRALEPPQRERLTERRNE